MSDPQLSVTSSGSAVIALPLRKSGPLSLDILIQSYISQVYGDKTSVDPSDYESMMQLRLQAINASDVHLHSIQSLLTWFAHFSLLLGKFLFDENNIKAGFPWTNAFMGRDRKGVTISHHHANYERASILYNVAALQSHLAARENVSQAEGLKRACHLYCSAMGTLQFIIEQLLPKMDVLPAISDLSVSMLTAQLQIMKAQAQECFVIKGVLDQMKDNLLARLAAQCADDYETAMSLASAEPHSSYFGTTWINHLACKRQYYVALAQVKRAAECLNGNKYGEEIARLLMAERSLKATSEWQKFIQSSLQNEIKTLQALITKLLVRANKDNDIIYHDPVPAAENLIPVTRADMVKSVPFEAGLAPMSLLLPGTKPLFSQLAPPAIHQASLQYKQRATTIVQSLQQRIRQQLQDQQQQLTQWQLPGAIQAAEQPLGLPDSILAASQRIRERGGTAQLQSSLETVKSLRDKAQNLLQQCEQVLHDEQQEDEAGRAQFQSRWTPAPSQQLTLHLYERIQRHSSTAQAAKSSDDQVQSLFESSFPFMESLSASKEELERAIPTCTSDNSLGKNNPHILRLKQLLQSLDQSKSTWQRLNDDAQKCLDSDDISAQLLASQSTPQETIFDQELKKYESLQSQFQSLLKKDVDLLKEIELVQKQFHATKSQDDSLKQRQQAIQNLTDASSHFNTLHDNLTEGVKFYNEFVAIVEHLLQDCHDFVSSRKLESKQLLTLIQARATAAAASVTPPTMPSYAMPGVTSVQQPSMPPSYYPVYPTNPSGSFAPPPWAVYPSASAPPPNNNYQPPPFPPRQ